MSASNDRETWRQLVVEYLESGEGLKRWATNRGIGFDTLYRRTQAFLKEEPHLFAGTKRFCPCPLMKRLLPHKNPQIRAYLKCLCFTLLDGRVVEAWPELHSNMLGYAADRLMPPASAKDINRDFLLFREFTNRSIKPRSWTRVTLFAAIESGVHADDPFFQWATENASNIQSLNGPNVREISKALQGDRFKRMRFVNRKRRDGMKCVSVVEYDTEDEFCAGLLDGFIVSRGEALHAYDKLFFGHFVESLGFAPRGLGDFSPDTFGHQAKWFRDRFPDKNEWPVRMVRFFYMYLLTLLPADQQTFTFATKLPPKAFGYTWIVERWLEGYGAVVYEPLDPAPAFAKWVLYPGENEARKSSFRADTPRAVDCSVDDPELERLLIGWLWSGAIGFSEIRTFPACAKLLLNNVINEDFRVVRGGKARRMVKTECVVAALTVLRKTNSSSRLTKIKNRYRAFLLFAESRGFLDVEPACYLLLESARGDATRDRGKDARSVSEEDLAALAGELERVSEQSARDELAYIACITQALTDLRFSEVLALKIGDIIDSSKSRYRTVRVCRKSGGYDFEEVEIPEEVYRLLKMAIELTAPVREKADPSIADRVFLVGGLMGTAKTLSPATCNEKFASACRRLNIPPITTADIRRAYMTTVIMEGAKRNWNRMILRPLTGHAVVESDRPYITPNIMNPETRRYLEGAYVVDIGNPQIRGEVLSDDLVREDVATLVANGAGICRNEECNILGTLPCLECKGFATSPRFIPEMVEAIAILDKQISAAPPHQREHLLSAKKRYLAYLGKMIDLDKRTSETSVVGDE